MKLKVIMQWKYDVFESELNAFLSTNKVVKTTYTSPVITNEGTIYVMHTAYIEYEE